MYMYMYQILRHFAYIHIYMCIYIYNNIIYIYIRLLTTGSDTLGLYHTTHDWWRYLRALLVVIVKKSY